MNEEFLTEFMRHREQLYGYIYSLLPHRDDAEDVFQKVSIILWQKYEQFQRDSKFLTWACGVAFYEVKNFIRVAQRDRLQFQDELIEKLSAECLPGLDRQAMRYEALQNCLQKLSQPDQTLIEAAYQQPASIKTYAVEKGRAIQTVYNNISIIRKKLLRCVEKSVEKSVVSSEGMA